MTLGGYIGCTKYWSAVCSFYERINRIYGVARTDFFRYLLMYWQGGVYLDIKSTATRPLDEVLTSSDYHLSQWRNGPGERYEGWGSYPDIGMTSEFQQWHIVAPPKYPFLKAVITKVMRNIDYYQPIILTH